MSEVKPCPFCGSECELQEIQYAFDLKQYAKHPYNDCILNSLPIVPVNVWNTRPLEDALQTEIDKLCVELNTNSTQISIQNDSIINMQKRIAELEAQNKALRDNWNSHAMQELRRLQAWFKYPPAPESEANNES